MRLAGQLLGLVPLLLGACAHLSPEMPLQQYWGVVSSIRSVQRTLASSHSEWQRVLGCCCWRYGVCVFVWGVTGAT